MDKKTFIIYFRNFVFGVEDSLVSTVGLLSGIAIAGTPKRIIILTGVVLIFVEAFSMASGSFLSEAEAEDISNKYNKKTHKNSLLSGIIMFVSYFFSGFIPLLPYTFLPAQQALKYSILFSLIALLILGIIGGKVSHKSLWKNALRTILVGGMAILIGILIGSWL